MDLSPRQIVAGTALVLGAVLVVAGLVQLYLRDRRASGTVTTNRQSRPAATQQAAVEVGVSNTTPINSLPQLYGWLRWIVSLVSAHRFVAGMLVAVVISGAALRLDGLDSKSATHTEALVPGIKLPVDFSWPPLRQTAYETFWWHFHSEGHPQGYYFFMWAWTKLAGSSVRSLRVPSAAFGIGAIVLLFTFASMVYGRSVGLLAAALLAFSGYHIYWSQYARMWSMGCFLGLLSSILLLRLVQSAGGRRWEIVYLLVTWLGAYTQVFLWPLLAGQILWVILDENMPSGRRHRVFMVQALVVILAASSLTHVIYLGSDVTAPLPSLSFVVEYISFGFLFETDRLSDPARVIPAGATYLLFAISVVCLIRSVSVPRKRLSAQESHSDLKRDVLVLPAIGSVLIILGLSTVAHRRHAFMLLTALVPIAAVMMPGILMRAGEFGRARLGAFARRLSGLPFLLFFAPLLIIFAMSFAVSLLANHAFLLFIPYLLVLIAAGVANLSKNPVVAVVLGVVLIAAHSVSVAHFRDYPATGRDYKGLVTNMSDLMEKDDIVFIKYRDWVVTPLFFYLDPYQTHFVAGNYDTVVKDNRPSRVWLLYFDSVRWGPYETASAEMEQALSSFAVKDSVAARRSVAKLFVREVATDDMPVPGPP